MGLVIIKYKAAPVPISSGNELVEEIENVCTWTYLFLVSWLNRPSSQFTPSSLSDQPFGDAAIHPFSSSESLTKPKEGHFPFMIMKGDRAIPSVQMQSMTVMNSRLPSASQI